MLLKLATHTIVLPHLSKRLHNSKPTTRSRVSTNTKETDKPAIRVVLWFIGTPLMDDSSVDTQLLPSATVEELRLGRVELFGITSVVHIKCKSKLFIKEGVCTILISVFC